MTFIDREENKRKHHIVRLAIHTLGDLSGLDGLNGLKTEELVSESLKVSAACWSWKLIYNSAENSNLWIISNKLTSLLNNQVLHTFQTFVFLYKVSSRSFFSDFSTLLRLLVKGRRVHVQTVAQHKKTGGHTTKKAQFAHFLISPSTQ